MSESATCPNCKIRECEFDVESGYYSTYCLTCFYLHANAPYCHRPECSARVCGTRTVLVNGREAGTTTAPALYACPNDHGKPATAIGWAIGSGVQSGKADAARKIETGDTLVDHRLIHIGRDVDAEHPVRRAYARAYVEAATFALAGV